MVSALKKLELIQTFFKFCYDSRWIDDNPARQLKKPKIVDRPTLPLEREEMTRILAACEAYNDSPIRN